MPGGCAPPRPSWCVARTQSIYVTRSAGKRASGPADGGGPSGQPLPANGGNVHGTNASVVSTVVVSRHDGMASLAGLLDRVREGEPAFAVIGGDAGVGKTRLAAELAAQAAAAQFTVLTGQCIALGPTGCRWRHW
jgi:AAA ATPase domain